MLPKEKAKAQRYLRKLAALTCGDSATATRLIKAGLYLWQRQAFPFLIKRRPRSISNFVENPLVIEFSGWLAELDTLTAAFWLSSAYSHCVGKELLKERAMFFTPPELSARVIDDLIANGASLTRHTWADPATGGGAFLAPVAMRMAEALKSEGKSAKGVLQHIAKHLVGNDIDPCLAVLSGEFLRMVLADQIRTSGFEPVFQVTTKNALTRNRHLSGAINVVICNPPYRKMSATEVDLYRNSYQETIGGQPNLYALFFKLTLDLLAPDGIAGLLTPTSFLSGRYFTPLRRYVRAHSDICQIDTLAHSSAFVGVEQEIAITVFRRRTGAQSLGEVRVFALTKNTGFRDIGVCRIPDSGAAWAIPRGDEDAKTLKAINGAEHRLADYGYVARVGAFVWNRDTRKTFMKPPSRKTKTVFPLIWSSDVGQDGSFQLGRQRPPGRHGNYVDLGTTSHSSIIRKPSVALQRVAELCVRGARVLGQAQCLLSDRTIYGSCTWP